MRSVLLSLGIVALLALAPFARAAGPDPDGAAFVELLGPPRAPYPHEGYALRLRIAFDPSFFATWAAPLFRRPLELPVQVVVPWADEDLLASPSRLVEVPADEDAVELALNDDVVEARRVGEVERGGRTLVVLEVVRRIRSAPPGPVELPAPVLRFAYGTRFEEDLFGERRPVDRHDVRVEGNPLVVRAQPLPEAGRPEAFTDAVGRFRLEVVAEEEGDGRFTVVMRIVGRGNLDTLTPPRLESGPALHVVGRLDGIRDGVREVRWEVETDPRAPGVVPALDFASFDPVEARWVTQRSEPIPLGRAPTPPATGEATSEASEGLALGGWIALGALLFVAGALLLRRRRTPRPDETAPVPREAGPPDARPTQEQALLAHAAAWLGAPPAAAIDAALANRLVARGMDPALARRLAEALEAWTAARYGGDAPDPARADALLAELDRLRP